MSVDCCTESANLLNDGLSFENMFDHRMYWCYGIYWMNLLFSSTDFCDDEYIDNLILECLRFCCCATVSVSLAWSKREWRLLFVMVRFNCCRKCLYSMWMLFIMTIYDEKEFAIIKTLKCTVIQCQLSYDELPFSLMVYFPHKRNNCSMTVRIGFVASEKSTELCRMIDVTKVLFICIW